VSYGTGGFGVSASMSRAHGDANSDAATQNNTHINASNTATIISGGDTNIVGANVNANKVIADVGGNLNLASVQDTSRSEAHQSSSGGGFSVSQGGGSASFSAQSGHASGNYAGVNEQAGIQAGDGGFDITVKGNTDLKGAYIASTATPDKNQLTTGTLSFSDIQNSSSYNASSFGISAGGGVGDGGNNYATHGQTSGKNTGGGQPLYVSESDSSNASTRSAISAGTITITDQANQKQDVATLNRGTSGLNGTVSKTPDLQQVLSNQSDLINAAQAAAETIAKQIGSYADKKREEAQTNANNATDPTLKAQYQQEADSWAEGGGNRVALHIAGGALTGGLTGGGLGAVGGAAGAGVSAKLAPQLSEIAQSIKDAGPTGNANVDELLGNLTSNVLAGGAGALVGGGTGALTGASADRFNRQLHPDERQWVKDKAKDFAKFYEEKTGKALTTEQAQNMLLANGYRLVDAVASKGPGGDATAVAYISQNGGGLFHATAAEYNSSFLYGNKDGTLTPEQRALPGSVANPAAGLVIAGGLVTAGLAPEIVAGGSAGVSYAQDLFTAYKAAQAAYSLTTAAATGAAVSGVTYTGGAAAGAGLATLKGSNFYDSFNQNFSLAALATATTFGAYNSIFTTSMLGWAGIPNSIMNIVTIPGVVIRGVGLALSQTAGKAAQAIVKSGEPNKQ
jgi:filamentous hemagglutinin